MGPETNKLVKKLEELITHLQLYQEDHWASWMVDARKIILKSDFRGIQKVEGAYGGMGSFNDLYLHPINNHKIKESEVDNANTKLQTLRTEIFKLVIHISKNAEISNNP